MAKTAFVKRIVRIIEKLEKLVFIGKEVKDELEDLQKPADDKDQQ